MSAPDQPSGQSASPPRNYDEALAAAIALQAAVAAPNPADVVARMSEQIITSRIRSALWAKAVLHGLWGRVNPYDDAQVNGFAKQAAQVMDSAQLAAGRMAAAGQVQQLAAVGIRADGIPTLPVDVRAPAASIARGVVKLQPHTVTVDYSDGAAKIAPHEMTTEAIFQRPAATFRYTQSVGGNAAQQANSRIDTLVDDNLMLAQRMAQTEVLARAVHLDAPGPKIIGYRRVIHPEMSRGGTCGMCIAAADRIYHLAELMPIHDRCHCTIAAVTEHHDPGDDANQADLAQLYKQAGGTSAAHLKRTRYQVDEHGELGAVLVPNQK